MKLNWPGVTVGYKSSDVSIALGIASEYPYDSAAVKDDPATKIKDETAAEKPGSHAVSAVLNVNVGPAKLDLAFVQGLENRVTTLTKSWTIPTTTPVSV